MNRQDLKYLREQSGYPAVSITLPTHETFPDNRQDPILLKNLLSRAEKRLLEEFDGEQAADVLENLAKAAVSVDHGMNAEGLAIYANHHMFRVYKLPFPPGERVVIDKTFHTRDLIHTMNRSERYWLLVLSKRPTRLFQGSLKNLTEYTEEPFPMEYSEESGKPLMSRGRGIRKSRIRDEYHLQFFRDIRDSFEKIHSMDPLPLFIFGVEKFASVYATISNVPVAGTMNGNFDKASEDELGRKAWLLVRKHLDEKRVETREKMRAAEDKGKLISTMEEIWTASREGRGEILLVEEGFHFPAVPSGSGGGIAPAGDPDRPGVIDDAVDEVIEAVIEAGGSAVFFPDGALGTNRRIALIARY